MAVNELDARTRAVEKMKADHGKEVEAYNAAENQLLAIRNEQKQNIAAARLEAAAAQQQNATVAQAAELVGSSSGATVQAPVNAATQGVLGKYGLQGPTVTKTASTQKSANTQQITKQNIVINNYNTTNNSTVNNTTTNVPNTGPVQGRPVVVNRDDTGRFKVWVNNVIARQNEQAAIRDREYQKRESTLSRSANKMTRKLEAISSTISRSLDPRRINNSTQDQLKSIFKLMGLGVIVANWPKVLNFLRNTEETVRDGFKYLGFGVEPGKESGLLKDLKYILLGKDGESLEGGFTATLKEFFMGEKGLLESIKKSLRVWWDDRSKAIQALKSPEWKWTDLGASAKNLVDYLAKVLGIIFESPTSGSKAGQAIMTSAVDEANTKQFSTPHTRASMSKFGNYEETEGGDKISTSRGDLMYGDYGKSLLNTDVQNGKLRKDHAGASIRQANAITANLSDDKGKINVLGLFSGIGRLQEAANANKNKYTVVDPKFLEILGTKLGIDVSDIGKEKKKFKYISIKKDDVDRAAEYQENFGISNFAGNAARAGFDAANLFGATVLSGGNPMAGVAATVVAESTGTSKSVANATSNAVQWMASEENTLRLVEEDDPAYANYKSLNDQLKDYGPFEFTILTAGDLEKLQQKIAEKVNNPSFSFKPDDVLSAYQLGEYMKGLDVNKGRELDQTYTNFVDSGYLRAVEYQRKQDEIWNNSLLNGMGNRTKEVAGEIKSDVVANYARTAPGEISGGNLTNLAFKDREEYVKTMRPLFQNILAEKNLPTEYANWLVTQSGIESAWGRSGLSQKYNNYSGIKARKGIDQSVGLSTTEYVNGERQDGVQQDFAVYNTVEDWARRYIDLLNNTYQAFTGDISSFPQRLTGDNNKGYRYATDPKYAEKLSNTLASVEKIEGTIAIPPSNSEHVEAPLIASSESIESPVITSPEINADINIPSNNTPAAPIPPLTANNSSNISPYLLFNPTNDTPMTVGEFSPSPQDSYLALAAERFGGQPTEEDNNRVGRSDIQSMYAQLSGMSEAMMLQTQLIATQTDKVGELTNSVLALASSNRGNSNRAPVTPLITSIPGGIV